MVATREFLIEAGNVGAVNIIGRPTKEKTK
jgi:hypothetical protein